MSGVTRMRQPVPCSTRAISTGFRCSLPGQNGQGPGASTRVPPRRGERSPVRVGEMMQEAVRDDGVVLGSRECTVGQPQELERDAITEIARPHERRALVEHRLRAVDIVNTHLGVRAGKPHGHVGSAATEVEDPPGAKLGVALTEAAYERLVRLGEVGGRVGPGLLGGVLGPAAFA